MATSLRRTKCCYCCSRSSAASQDKKREGLPRHENGALRYGDRRTIRSAPRIGRYKARGEELRYLNMYLRMYFVSAHVPLAPPTCVPLFPQRQAQKVQCRTSQLLTLL